MIDKMPTAQWSTCYRESAAASEPLATRWVDGLSEEISYEQL